MTYDLRLTIYDSPGGLAKAYAPHNQHGFQHYLGVHFARADPAVVENDGRLAYLEAQLVGAVRKLYLERITVGVHVFQVERFEHFPPERLETARKVVIGRK